MKLFSLAALDIISTTSGAASDENVINIKMFQHFHFNIDNDIVVTE